MRWDGHVERMGEKRCPQEFDGGDLSELDYLEGLGAEGRIILK
jgi:hypothetical protein